MAPSRSGWLHALTRRLFFAVIFTALLLLIASAAVFVTTAPAPISLLLEPFSLLLMPGMIASLAFTGSHSEVSSADVLIASACFYLVVLSLAPARWLPSARTHSRSR